MDKWDAKSLSSAALLIGAYADGATKQDFLSRSPKGAEWIRPLARKELDLESQS